jgi:hypothetical protein
MNKNALLQAGGQGGGAVRIHIELKNSKNDSREMSELARLLWFVLKDASPENVEYSCRHPPRPQRWVLFYCNIIAMSTHIWLKT